MKKRIITLAIAPALATTNTSAYATEILRESAPLNAMEAQILCITYLRKTKIQIVPTTYNKLSLRQ